MTSSRDVFNHTFASFILKYTIIEKYFYTLDIIRLKINNEMFNFKMIPFLSIPLPFVYAVLTDCFNWPFEDLATLLIKIVIFFRVIFINVKVMLPMTILE